MKILLSQNIMTHKRKNQLTAIIYALTIGSIIFLLTCANLQIQTITQTSTIDGADIILESMFACPIIDLRPGEVNSKMIDPVLKKYSGSIKSSTFISERLEWAESGAPPTQLG